MWLALAIAITKLKDTAQLESETDGPNGIDIAQWGFLSSWL